MSVLLNFVRSPVIRPSARCLESGRLQLCIRPGRLGGEEHQARLLATCRDAPEGQPRSPRHGCCGPKFAEHTSGTIGAEAPNVEVNRGVARDRREVGSGGRLNWRAVGVVPNHYVGVAPVLLWCSIGPALIVLDLACLGASSGEGGRKNGLKGGLPKPRPKPVSQGLDLSESRCRRHHLAPTFVSDASHRRQLHPPSDLPTSGQFRSRPPKFGRIRVEVCQNWGRHRWNSVSMGI